MFTVGVARPNEDGGFDVYHYRLGLGFQLLPLPRDEVMRGSVGEYRFSSGEGLKVSLMALDLYCKP